MYMTRASVAPENVCFTISGLDTPAIRELQDIEIDSVSGGFVCGGVCVGAAIVGAVVLLGGAIYVGWQAAHNTAE